MTTYQVDILNPKATKLLQDLADMDLIAIKQTAEGQFLKSSNVYGQKLQVIHLL